MNGPAAGSFPMQANPMLLFTAQAVQNVLTNPFLAQAGG